MNLFKNEPTKLAKLNKSKSHNNYWIKEFIGLTFTSLKTQYKISRSNSVWWISHLQTAFYGFWGIVILSDSHDIVLSPSNVTAKFKGTTPRACFQQVSPLWVPEATAKNATHVIEMKTIF